MPIPASHLLSLHIAHSSPSSRNRVKPPRCTVTSLCLPAFSWGRLGAPATVTACGEAPATVTPADPWRVFPLPLPTRTWHLKPKAAPQDVVGSSHDRCTNCPAAFPQNKAIKTFYRKQRTLFFQACIRSFRESSQHTFQWQPDLYLCGNVALCLFCDTSCTPNCESSHTLSLLIPS